MLHKRNLSWRPCIFQAKRHKAQYVYVTQANFTTKRRFEIKNKGSLTEMNFQSSKVEKNTHEQKVQMQKFCSQTRFAGEIYLFDVIIHRGYSYFEYF